MGRNDDNDFFIDPPPELDSKVFAKVAPVLKENKQIANNKKWFQLWMPAATTAALTVAGVWFFNKKANQGSGGESLPIAATGSEDMDFESFASLDIDEENWDLISDLDLIEELDVLEDFSEDDENS
jgi:hypothetical protein